MTEITSSSSPADPSSQAGLTTATETKPGDLFDPETFDFDAWLDSLGTPYTDNIIVPTAQYRRYAQVMDNAEQVIREQQARIVLLEHEARQSENTIDHAAARVRQLQSELVRRTFITVLIVLFVVCAILYNSVKM
jgi:hypothetical protein